MTTAVALPIIPAGPYFPSWRKIPGQEKPQKLPRVVRTVRNGPLLHPGPAPEYPNVVSLNLAMGCAQRCTFCSARAYPTYPGDEVVYLYRDSAPQLERELASRRELPRGVYLSPSTDPFQPLVEVQTETAKAVEVLATHGVESWLMTRGWIRPFALRVLEKHRDLVRVTVGLITVNRTLQRVLEPRAPSPRLRLKQIARLRDRNIRVHVALEPLVPGLTDTRANLMPMLEALAGLGIRHVSASYIFLRPGIKDNLVQGLEAHGWDERVLNEFAGGRTLKSGNLAPACYLPRVRRQRGYAALMALASEVGITVSISSLTNPDFGTGRTAELPAGSRQQLLPLF